MVTRYQLFTFPEENAEDSLSIDFAPSEWVDFDQDKGKLMCKFMPPPYNKKNLQILDTMRKRCDPPLGEWPSYPIEIRGSAKIYSDAIMRTKKLEEEKYAHSPNVQLDGISQSMVNTEVFKQMATIKSKPLTLREKLNKVSVTLEKKCKKKNRNNLKIVLNDSDGKIDNDQINHPVKRKRVQNTDDKETMSTFKKKKVNKINSDDQENDMVQKNEKKYNNLKTILSDSDSEIDNNHPLKRKKVQNTDDETNNTTKKSNTINNDDEENHINNCTKKNNDNEDNIYSHDNYPSDNNDDDDGNGDVDDDYDNGDVDDDDDDYYDNYDDDYYDDDDDDDDDNNGDVDDDDNNGDVDDNDNNGDVDDNDNRDDNNSTSKYDKNELSNKSKQQKKLPKSNSERRVITEEGHKKNQYYKKNYCYTHDNDDRFCNDENNNDKSTNNFLMKKENLSTDRLKQKKLLMQNSREIPGRHSYDNNLNFQTPYSSKYLNQSNGVKFKSNLHGRSSPTLPSPSSTMNRKSVVDEEIDNETGILQTFNTDNVPSEIEILSWIKSVLYNVRDWEKKIYQEINREVTESNT
ncbi:hypothetical protein HCN44_011041 [Aphidius gifuensis]|uniref:Uncharacterized protein n=1 Tax=Aphidius gifuensis TaxID=684658 RepID=A0A835CNL5_APHGI|nr:hypothetical protein HCN44_011041 [Aphidius gifuensis]